jgi:hypothetical protein
MLAILSASAFMPDIGTGITPLDLEALREHLRAQGTQVESRIYTVSAAKDALPDLVRQAESGRTAFLVRRGNTHASEPVLIIKASSVGGGEPARAARRTGAEVLQRFNRTVDLSDLRLHEAPGDTAEPLLAARRPARREA